MPRAGWSPRRAEPRRAPRRLTAATLLAALALALTCCDAAEPSTTADPDIRLACLSVKEAACESIAGEVRGRMAGAGSLVAMSVESFPCDIGQCPPGFEARQEYSIVAEFTAPPRIRQFGATTMFTGSLQIDAGMDTESVVVLPVSVRTGERARPLSLGLCGLGSPIDADGSLWDAVGAIDSRHDAAANAAPGQFSLTGETTARFQSDSGFAVNLLRRAGPKSYRLCA
jgi:hypothetical protein